MVNWKSKRLEDFLKLAIGLVVVIVLNMIAEEYFVRIDLTEEGRYSIKEPTKEMLRELDDVVYVEVYLDGELNAGFKRLKKSIAETLEEFRIYSGRNIQYAFNDPTLAMSQKAKGEFMRQLMQQGIQPTNIIDNQDGQRIERLVFPGALVSYGGAEKGVMLLKGNQSLSAEQKLNQSIENVEYELASAIKELTSLERKSVGIVKGHGTLTTLETAGFRNALNERYNVRDVLINEALNKVDALILAKPTKPFTELEKYHLDQYLMSGGSVLMLIDKLNVNMDSVASEHNFSFPYELNLDDQLFKYGVRVNSDLVQDNTSGVYPIVVGNMGDQPQVNLLPWPFFPVINRFADHPVTKNLNTVLGRFMNSVDTVALKGVKKTPLLMTSDYSRTVTAPVKVSIQDLRKNLGPEVFNQQNVPLGWLLEGRFTSLYKNRFKPEGVEEEAFVSESSSKAKLIVIGDGDLAKNEINPNTGQPQPLGYDPFLNETFANEELLMNALAYMVEDAGLILARNKEVKIRPLDSVKVKNEKLKWQMINLVLPIVALLLFGVVRFYLRKKKYSKFDTQQ
ncbi:gliding motility-associated ABC transporter substrate-binding protein GldG [Fulvivirga sp. RKSG066]|uniref:gliding motility-associated ABC transporter substrate-binding protein GldG n=1 Tax=Fulvivirga aurantia TaxID=2529383 RepID=UPI0012BB6604|nr:gliding motility-associated ABC transporter substrate-binding protein GldG [Fulvivirga aurantia]MTI21180.1 gliding motility-associated ABC transporter substrate-binding protein GldG [Fulvivirga aurantia]